VVFIDEGDVVNNVTITFTTECETKIAHFKKILQSFRFGYKQ